jgi:phosphorylcholine metabolism protein LicD
MKYFDHGDDLLELIKTVKFKLETEKIQFWLDEGTLLGAIRDKKIIKGDVDVDFSITHTNLPKLLDICNSLKLDGYHIKYQKYLPFVEDLVQIYPKHSSKMEGMHIDFNIYYLNNDSAVRRDFHYPVSPYAEALLLFSRALHKGGNINTKLSLLFSIFPGSIRIWMSQQIMKFYIFFFSTIWQVVPKYYFTEFQSIKFLDMSFDVPSDYQDYLAFRYGDDWRTPNSKWLWKSSVDKAIQYRKLNSISITLTNSPIHHTT